MAMLSKLLGAVTDLKALSVTVSVGTVLLLYVARVRSRRRCVGLMKQLAYFDESS